MPKYLKRYKDTTWAKKCRNRQRKLNYARGIPTIAKHTRKKWSKEDKNYLNNLSGFYTDRQIAIIMSRSVQAIQVQRCRMIKE